MDVNWTLLIDLRIRKKQCYVQDIQIEYFKRSHFNGPRKLPY